MNILAADNPQARTIWNPAGQTPALGLDDGSIVSETYAIMEYLEEKHPEPAADRLDAPDADVVAPGRARRLRHPMVQGFYYARASSSSRRASAACLKLPNGMKERARDGMRIDGLITGEWLAGNPLAVADVCLYCYIDQLCEAGQPVPDDCKNLQAWFRRIGTPPAARAQHLEKASNGHARLSAKLAAEGAPAMGASTTKYEGADVKPEDFKIFEVASRTVAWVTIDHPPST